MKKIIIILFLVLFCAGFSTKGQSFSAADILVEADQLKENNQCDSAVVLLNNNLTRLKEAGENSWMDYYESALSRLEICYETLAMIDEVDQIHQKQLAYTETKYGIKSPEYYLLTYHIQFFWGTQKNTDKQIEAWKLQLNPARYDLKKEEDKNNYNIHFSTCYYQCKELVPAEQLEATIKQIVQGNKYGLELLQNEIDQAIAFQREIEQMDTETEAFIENLSKPRVLDLNDELDRWVYSDSLDNVAYELWKAADDTNDTSDYKQAITTYEKLTDFYLQHITDPYFKDNYIGRLFSTLPYLYEEKLNDYENGLQIRKKLKSFIELHHLESEYQEYYEETMDRIAFIYDDRLKNIPKAIESYLELEKYYKKQHNNEKVIEALKDLSTLYRNLKDMDNWEKYLTQIVEISLNTYGKTDYRYGESLDRLGTFYIWDKPDYDRSIELLTEAKKTNYLENNREAGYQHVLEHLGFAKIESGKVEEGAMEFEEAGKYWDSGIYEILFSTDTHMRNMSWSFFSPKIYRDYDMAYRFNAKPFYNLSYNNTLLSKGLLLRAGNAIRNAILSSNDPILINKWEEVNRLREQYNNDTTQQLEYEITKLDREITRTSAAYRDLKADLQMSWQDVQKQLKPGEAALEFVDFMTDNYNKNIYAVLILLPGINSPAWIPLCDSKELEALLQTESTDTQKQTETLYSDKGKELYQLIWKELDKELQGVKTIYYSPSGLLHKIAFNALPTDNENSLLSDKYNLHLLSSTREITRLKKEATVALTQDSTVIYGGLAYDIQQSSMLAAAKHYNQPNEETSESSDRFVDRFRRRDAELPNAELRSGFSDWKYLAGTKNETEQIVSSLKNKHIPHQYYTGDQGNEESFKHLSGTKTRIIHLATHGFFLPDIKNKNIENIVQRLGGPNEESFENPMLRSGLIMSGANNQWIAKEYIMEDGIEDGILTADEISKLDLTKTKLVVMSACETGLGDANNCEGVFGLQRAFKLAGVESLIMSLWKVPDEATSELMTTFYQQWLSGQSKQNAFKTAQQKVREKYQSPYYWAAFVMMD